MSTKKTELKKILHLAFGTGNFFYLTIFSLVLTASLTLAIPLSFRFLIDLGIKDHNKTVFIILVSMAVILAFGTALRYYSVNIVGERIFHTLRKNIFKSILGFSTYETEKFRTGDLMSRLMADAEVIRSFAGSSLSIAARNILLLSGGLIMMFITSPILALLSLSIMPVILIPILVLGRKLKSQSKQAQGLLSVANTRAEEIIYALRTIQNFNRQTIEYNIFNDKMNAYYTSEKHRINLRSFLTFIVISFVFIGVVGMLWYGTYLIQADEITAGLLTQFLLYAIFTAGASSSLSEVFSELQKASAAYGRIKEVSEIKPTIFYKDGLYPNHPLRGNIEINNLSFSYPNREEVIFDNINISIKAGDKIQIQGKSGIGKSTLFQLLLKHRLSNSGEIFFDNYSINDLSPEYIRNNIAYVSQDIKLVTGTVKENIAFNDPAVSDEIIEKVAKEANMHDFIISLKNGYNTYLGEKGIELSGGQKQRLALARALLSKKPILLLDEPTSSLDEDNKKQIIDNLMHIMNNNKRTVILISHDEVSRTCRQVNIS